VEDACERHENNAKADARSSREHNKDGRTAEQAEVEHGDEVGDRGVVDRDPRDPP
jgi:hypothetical protein